MSAYYEFETVFRDGKHLAAALQAMGFEPECHAQPQTLYGYHGDARKEAAHIIIRRQQISSAANDVGFVQDPSGTYRAIISQFDRSRFNDSWMCKLKQGYAEQRTMALARTKGYIFQGRRVEQKQDGEHVTLLFAQR